jgi:hypothetical protein
MADELVLGTPCEKVASRAIELLNTAGFIVVRSFDLLTARSLIPDCACPHHGTTDCDCQYSVLLVYGVNTPPLTPVIHGQDGYSWLMVTDNSGQTVNPIFLEVVRQLLSLEYLLTRKGE